MVGLPTRLPGKSLKTQLITLLFALTALVIVVLGFLAVRAVQESGQRTAAITATSMKERVRELLVQTTDATAEKNSIIFKTIETRTVNAAEYVKNILMNPTDYPNKGWRFDDHVVHRPAGNWSNSSTEASSIFIQSTLSVTPAIKREIELTAYLDHIFPQILKNEPNAVALYFEGPQGETRYYPNIGLEKLVPPDYDSTTGEYFTVANPQNNPEGKFRWSKVYDDPAGHGLTITAAQPIYLPARKFAGMVDMDITLNNIAKNIENYSPIQSSYAFLIDGAGRAVALPNQGYKDMLGRAPKANEFGSDLSTVTGEFGSVLQKMRQGHGGFSEVRAGNEDLFVAYKPITGTTFSLGIVARQSAMLGVVAELQQQVDTSTSQVLYQRIVPVAIVLLLLVWLVGFIFIRLITEPIKRLTAKTAEVASGNFEVAPEAGMGHNEIGQLAHSFNRMVGDLRTSRAKIEQQNQALLHNEQTRLKASINSLNVGFIMTDTNNQVAMMNNAAKHLMSKDTRRDWSAAEISERLGPIVAFEENVAKVLRTGTPVEKKEVAFGDSVLRVFIAPIVGEPEKPGKSQQKLGAVVLMEDITEAKLLEHARDEFFSIASHELRTPLTAVRGNAALLQQVYTAKVHETDFDDMVGDIHDASVRLIAIVNDFLDATRLEQGKIKFETQAFSVADILKAVADEMTAVAKEQKTRIKIGPHTKTSPAIWADKNRVKQVVYNLVGNAMKFTTAGTITLDARVEGKVLKVLVHDTGVGIPEEAQNLLFHKFQQASNGFLTRESRGTGLGLYISKLLTEQMGGRIALEESKLGAGTTFSFTVPLANEDQSKSL